MEFLVGVFALCLVGMMISVPVGLFKEWGLGKKAIWIGAIISVAIELLILFALLLYGERLGEFDVPVFIFSVFALMIGIPFLIGKLIKQVSSLAGKIPPLN